MTQTLEESAKIFVNNRFSKQISGDNTYPDIYASKESIIESHILFAKWQQEQSKEMEKEQKIEFARHCLDKAKEMEKEQKLMDMQEYAEFCIMCDRKQMPLLLVEDWYKHYKSE